MKRVLMLGIALVAAACVAQPQTTRDLDRISSDYQREANAAPPAERPDGQDTCGMAEHQDLIGKMQSEFQLPSNARVICFGCMATMDFNASRLTIQLGPDHRVASMRCG